MDGEEGRGEESTCEKDVEIQSKSNSKVSTRASARTLSPFLTPQQGFDSNIPS